MDRLVDSVPKSVARWTEIAQGMVRPQVVAVSSEKFAIQRGPNADEHLHPADEIDAIGKARGNGSGDAGTQEREQGLMQMLYEMDGFASNDGVLVVGATNRVNLLDDALLRKGRFDMTIYMGRPSTNNRFKILQVRLCLWSAEYSMRQLYQTKCHVHLEPWDPAQAKTC